MADVSDHLEDPANVVWVDFCEPDAADLAAIAEELQLHPLAVEDAVTEHQRPKLDRYDTHLFVTGYAVRLDTAPAGWSPPRSTRSSRRTRWSPSASPRTSTSTTSWPAGTTRADLLECGVSFLLQGLLDVVVDGHFDAVQALDDEHRGARGPAVRRPPAQPGGAAAVVRAAQEPGPAAPGRAADARGRERPDAPRPARRRRRR